MTRTFAAVAAIVAAALTYLAPAHAATAILVSCETGTSVTGKFIWIGIYDYMGQRVKRVFTQQCPLQIEVQ